MKLPVLKDMIIVRLGGSVLNPDGHYSEEAINHLTGLLEATDDNVCIVVGGGSMCRDLQEAAKPILDRAKLPIRQEAMARDELGIAITKINARYLQDRLGPQVCPDLVIDPYHSLPKGFRIYVATGYTPGNSTDYVAMLLAKNTGAKRVIKASNVKVVLDVKAMDFKDGETYDELPRMTWDKMLDIAGTEWVPGGKYPLDPPAAKLGAELGVELLMGLPDQLESMMTGEFVGTKVS